MIRLDTTTRKLRAYLGGAVATLQPHVSVSYSDKSSSSYAGATKLTVMNGPTVVDICAAPASGAVRDIDHVQFHNRDTASVDLSVVLDDNGTAYAVIDVTLDQNNQLEYTHGTGWRVLDGSGAIKTILVTPSPVAEIDFSAVAAPSFLTGRVWYDATTNRLSFYGATGANNCATTVDIAGRDAKTGIDTDVAGAYTSTLTYNETTRTVTIAPTGATFDVYVLGTKYSKTAQSLAHSSTGAAWFFYFDATGTLVVSSSPWNLLTHAPVAFVFQDATNNRRICFEERHHAGRDVWWHRNQHINEGTKASSGFGISGYTLNNGATDAAVKWAIATGRLEDEDIQLDTSAVVAGGPYVLMERSGAAGDWQMTRTSTLPYLFTGATLQYNQNTGATWQRTNVPEDAFVNIYILGVTAIPASDVTPNPGAVQQVVIIPGQVTYASQTLANAATISEISWGTLPFQELCPLYQVTLRFNASNPSAYTNTTRTAIVAITRIVGTAANITQTASADHGALSGLADDDHLQYALADGSRGAFEAAGAVSAYDAANHPNLQALVVNAYTIPTDYQHLVYGHFSINTSVTLDGELVIL